LKKETMAAMTAVEELLRGGDIHSLTSVGGAVRSMSRSATANLLDKLEAVGVVETFTVVHSQPSIGGANKRIRLRCARSSGRTLEEALGQQTLSLTGDICLPAEQELVLTMLRQLVTTHYPKAKTIKTQAWPATKLGWHRTLERMVRLDGVGWTEQLELLTWLVESRDREARFWAGQARSAEAFRRHYAAIHGKRSAGEKRTVSIDEAWEDV